LNNTRALIKLFDGVIYKEQFIMLPGDEIVEKKHKNIKHLIAMERSEDLSKRPTRKFPGLGNSVFQIDFAKQFASVYGVQEDEEEKAYDSNATRPGSSKATASAMKKPQSPKGGKRPTSPAQSAKSEVQDNELAAEIEIQNTIHHKAIIKARNENYLTFKKRF
jgi:hypothetical protein